MRYRIENVSIPVSAGIAQPGHPALELAGRRIIHVVNVNADRAANIDRAIVTVITEEDE